MDSIHSRSSFGSIDDSAFSPNLEPLDAIGNPPQTDLKGILAKSSYAPSSTDSIEQSPHVEKQSRLTKYAKITAIALGVIVAVGIIVASALATHGVSLGALGFVGKFIAAHTLATQVAGGTILAIIGLGAALIKKEKQPSSLITEIEYPNLGEINIPTTRDAFDLKQGVLGKFRENIGNLQFDLVDGETTTNNPQEVLRLLDVKPKDFGIRSFSMDKTKIGLLHLLGNNCSNISEEELTTRMREIMLAGERITTSDATYYNIKEDNIRVTLQRDLNGKVFGLEIESRVSIPQLPEEGQIGSLERSTIQNRKTRITFDYGFFGTKRVPEMIRVDISNQK